MVIFITIRKIMTFYTSYIIIFSFVINSYIFSNKKTQYFISAYHSLIWFVNYMITPLAFLPKFRYIVATAAPQTPYCTILPNVKIALDT